MEGQHPGQTIAPHVGGKTVGAPQPPPPASQPHAAQLNSNQPDGDSVSWTASEFIEHNKNASWYAGLAAATLVVAAGIFLLTRDKISTGVIIFAAIVLGISAARKPRVLQYRLDEAGLTIGSKFYSYDLFKSFSVVDEGAVPSIYLLPLRRFMPSLNIYYAPEDEENIINMLADRLPHEERQVDAVDRFMHRIRF